MPPIAMPPNFVGDHAEGNDAEAVRSSVGWVERSETHQSAREEAIADRLLHPSYAFASDATASISISIFGSGSACTTQVVRAG